jgi:chloramphenicol 3-O phosphotransferase
MILLLNGVSSSGKSSIAKALQECWPKPLLHLGLDHFIAMMSPRFFGTGPEAHLGFRFAEIVSEHDTTWRIDVGQYGQRLCEGVIKVAQDLHQLEFDLVLDEVLFEDESLQSYVQALQDITVYFIAVHCSLEVAENRERERSDRALGSARDQFSRVHGPTRFYDLEVDTSQTTSVDIAKQIMNYIKRHPKPSGFSQLKKAFHIA